MKIAYSPTIENAYYADKHIWGGSLNLIPALNIRLSKTFQAEASIPLKVYDLWLIKTDIHNPAIPTRHQQIECEWKNDAFMNAYSLRLALCIDLKS